MSCSPCNRQGCGFATNETAYGDKANRCRAKDTFGPCGRACGYGMNADMNANMFYGDDMLCSPRNHQGCGFAENETSRVVYKFCQVDVEPLNKFERGRGRVGMVLIGAMPAQDG